MICPRCGSTITMSEYKCSGCALDLHCNTPEGRQKAEQYANQMYASGKWKVRQPVQSITDIPKPEEKPKVVYEKPKRNQFKIATIILAITTAVLGASSVILFFVAKSFANDISEIIAEKTVMKVQMDNMTERISELEKPFNNTQEELKTKYWAYKYSIGKDKRGMESLLYVVEKISGEDMSPFRDQIQSLYETQSDGLNVAYKSPATDEAKIEAMDGMNEAWDNAMANLYQATIDLFE